MIPARHASTFFSFLLSAQISLIISGFNVIRRTGFNGDLPVEWLAAWLPGWALAFPSVLVLAPLTRRIVSRLTA